MKLKEKKKCLKHPPVIPEWDWDFKQIAKWLNQKQVNLCFNACHPLKKQCDFVLCTCSIMLNLSLLGRSFSEEHASHLTVLLFGACVKGQLWWIMSGSDSVNINSCSIVKDRCVLCTLRGSELRNKFSMAFKCSRVLLWGCIEKKMDAALHDMNHTLENYHPEALQFDHTQVLIIIENCRYTSRVLNNASWVWTHLNQQSRHVFVGVLWNIICLNRFLDIPSHC